MSCCGNQCCGSSTSTPKKQRIFHTTRDLGDGSCATSFFESQECIDLMENHFPDQYYSGTSWFDVDGTIEGLKVKTLRECQEEVSYASE